MKSGLLRVFVCLSLAFSLTASMALAPGVRWTEAAAAEATLSDVLREAWSSCTERVDVSGMGLTKSDYAEAIYNVFYDTPECFHLSNFGASLESGFSTKIKALTFEYTVSKAEYQEQLAAYQARVSEAVSVIDSSWSEMETALYLHDWIAANSQYDLDYQAYDAYQVLVNGKGVCQASALAFVALGRAVGLETHMLTTDEQVHAWNVVKIGGSWYHLDVSNDDGSPDIPGFVTHGYFLKSDALMMADDHHVASDWKIRGVHDEIVCDSTKYDSYFWDNSMDTFERIGNGWFAVLDDTPQEVTYSSDIVGGLYIYHYNADTDTFVPTLVKQVQDAWKVWNKTGSVYTAYLGLSGVFDGRLYYGTSTAIYSMKPDGSDLKTVYQLSEAELAAGRLYGLYIAPDGLLHYMVRPSVSSSENAINATIQLESSQPLSTTTTTTTTVTTTTTATTTTTPVTTTTKPRTTTTPVTTTTQPRTTTTPVTTTTKPRTTTTPVTTTTKPRTTTTPVTTTTQPRTTTTPVTTTTKPRTTTTPVTTTTKPRTTTTPVTTTTKPRTTTTPVTTTTKPRTTTTPVTTTTTLRTTVTTVTTTTTTTTTAEERQMYGDINLDGTISIADVVRLARFVSQDDTLSPPMTAQAIRNANCLLDSNVDAQDVAQLSRFLVGLGGLPSALAHANG